MAENAGRYRYLAYYFKKMIKLTYLPAFSAFVSNFQYFQPFSAVSAIFSFRLII
jgi:hypothetical protein